MQDVNKRGAGDYVQEIHRDVYSVDQLFSELFSRALPQMIFAGVAFAILLNINWQMTLGIFISGIILFPLFSTCNRKVNDLSEISRDTFIGISDHLVETIGGFRDIMALGHFDRFSKRFEDLLKKAQACGVSLAWWGQVGGIVTVSIMSLFSAVPIIVVIPKLLKAQAAGQSGEVTYLIGSTISYVLFLQQFLQVYNIAYHFLEQVAATSPSLHSLRQTVSVRAGTLKRSAASHSGPLSPVESISFEDVSMDFDGYPVFEGIGFLIPGGKISAIVGQSGSGKTTIFNLLLGLLEPTGGTISINGRPLETINEKRLKKMMGLIPQDPFIFNCSIRENLLMATTEIPDEQTLDRAIRLSQLHHFIETHQEGLDFVAGHMGRNLSAGEKQRLALARLILQDPAIIICDEYTANIDLKIAGLIHDVMRNEFAGRTRIIISHQLYTIRGADHIIVLDHGAIAETGTHEELLNMGGVYRSLWDLQRLA
jgi:ABC-type multidrug transport system fused ATPase/permease subunit